WTAGGWGFGFAAGVGRPWWGPVGWHDGWGGAGWRAGWGRGWGGRYADTHLNHINFNNFNVYNRWNPNIHVTAARNAVIAPRRETNVVHPRWQLNNVVAGRDGHVYRPASGGGWETHTGQGWSRVEPPKLPAERRTQFQAAAPQLSRDWAARRAGEANYHA